MGKMVIILIVGLTIIVGIISASITGRTSDASKTSAAGFTKTYAKDIASSAAEYYLRQVKATPTLRGTFSISSILDGSATVQLQDWTTGVSDSIKLTSIGTYASAKETVTVKIVQGSSFPVLNSAINFRTAELEKFDVSGTLSIDGRDHDINNVLLSPSSNDRCGASVSTPGDTSQLVPSHASQINGTQDVLVDAAISDPQTFATALISNADYTLTGTYTSEQTWGSPSSPKIVYCYGNVKFKGNCTGWGILLINDDKFSDKNLTFYGLVMLYNASDTEVKWESKGQMTIVGGLILSGSSEVEYKSSGQAYIHYSKQALDLAKTRSSGGGGLVVSNWSD